MSYREISITFRQFHNRLKIKKWTIAMFSSIHFYVYVQVLHFIIWGRPLLRHFLNFELKPSTFLQVRFINLVSCQLMLTLLLWKRFVSVMQMNDVAKLFNQKLLVEVHTPIFYSHMAIKKHIILHELLPKILF